MREHLKTLLFIGLLTGFIPLTSMIAPNQPITIFSKAQQYSLLPPSNDVLIGSKYQFGQGLNLISSGETQNPPSVSHFNNLTQPNATLAVTAPSFSDLHDNGVYIGPHVMVEGSWTELEIPGFPSVKIQQSQLLFYQRVEVEAYGTITEGIGGWFNDNDSNIEAFFFVNLTKSSEVHIMVEYGSWVNEPGGPLSHQGDIDIFAWPPGVEHTFANNLIPPSTACCRYPEVGYFIAPVSGNYTIGIDFFSGSLPMGWRLDTRWRVIGLNVTVDERTIEVDTYNLGNNNPCDLRFRFYTGTSLDENFQFTSLVRHNVTFLNFFPPEVTIVSPNGGEELLWAPINIIWSGTDLNVEDRLHYSIEISNDTGTTWLLIEDNTTAQEILWNPQDPVYGLPPGNEFQVRVNVTDGRWTTSDKSDGTWVMSRRNHFPFPWVGFLIFVGGITIIVLLVVLPLISYFNYRRRRRRETTK